jgi:hypothetical protein
MASVTGSGVWARDGIAVRRSRRGMVERMEGGTLSGGKKDGNGERSSDGTESRGTAVELE